MTMPERANEPDTIGHRFHEAAHLFLPAVPIGVFLLSSLLFELAGTDTPRLHTAIRSLTAASSEAASATTVLSEGRARLDWLATVVIELVVAMYCLASSILMIRQAQPHIRRTCQRLAWILSVVGLVQLWLVAVTDNAQRRIVFGLPYETLRHSGHVDETLLFHTLMAISAVNIVAYTVPLICLVAASCIPVPPPPDQQPHQAYFQSAFRRLREFTFCWSALLVVGIMHMGAWLSWPAALATKSEQREAILGWTTSVTVYWGATFSLVVIAAYVPAGWLLLSRARQTLRNEMSEDELEKWLQEYSLTVAPKHQLSRLAVILAPMLAGPVGGMISRALSGSGE